MISSVEFAKFLLNEAKEKDIQIKPTKLHKLLYICHGFMLAFDVDLISDEPNAWNYGPVYSKIADWLDADSNVLNAPSNCAPRSLKEIENVEAKKVTDYVLKRFGHWSASELSMWSHAAGGPWERSILWNGTLNGLITKEDMKEYFKTLLNNK
jgi:uncharacterized phage-associated protein